jgi:uncharacterized protein (DUF427 family)
VFGTKEEEVFSTDDLQLLLSPKRIRVRFGGEWLADSTRAALLRENGHLPVYYIPREDVRMDLLRRTDHVTSSERKGRAVYWTVRSGGRSAENAAWAYPEPGEGAEALADYVEFDWDAMDAWFEEDEEVDVHPRDPFHRVDTRRSSRHLKLELGGVIVAETTRPTLLFETSLPTRYYIPPTDVRLDLLEPSDHTTGCPYKGRASYLHVRVGDKLHRNLVWSYSLPRAAAFDVRGMMAFYTEKIDALYVDGEKVEKPPVF